MNVTQVARPFLTRTIAGIAAIALVLGGSLAGASAASADAARVVTVSPATNVDTTVANTFTVTGSGFTGDGAANGAYVNLGTTSAWTPGTVPSTGGFVTTSWVQPARVVDGAFTTTLTVPANTFDPAGNYSVSTFAAHGLSITDRTLDTLTPITLKPVVPAANPVVTVTPNSAIDPAAANTFTIAGTGFTGPGAANGTYVNIGATSAWTPGSVPDASKFVASGWVQPRSIANGAFSTTLVVPAGSLDPAGSYSVATFAAHALSVTDRSLDSLTPITLKPVVPVANPVVTVTPNTDIDPAVATTLTITGTGFIGAGAANGTYVNVGSTTAWTPGSAPDASKFLVSGWVMPRSIVNGSFTTTLVVPAGKLDRTLSYGVATFAAHALSATDRSLDSFTPIIVKPLPVPTVTVSKSTLSSAGETITVTGSGFTPNAPATSGTRPPLAGKFTGAYVTFGKFAEVWKPSAGATSSARAADRSTLKWFVNEADVATVGGASAGAAAIDPDGTFSVDMLVKPGYSGEPSTGNYGIYTYPGGGAAYAPFETYTPIAFTTLVSPKVTVTPSTDVDPTVANTFTITGTGFTGAGAANGTYVNVGSVDAWTPGTVPDASKFVASGWVMPRSIVDGAFTATLVVPANTLDRSVKYGVATFAAQGLSVTDRTLDTFTPFALKALVAAPTATTLTATPAAITVGQSTTLTAQVAPGTAGSYTFSLGDAVIGTATASAAGAGSYTVENLPVGAQLLTARFTPASNTFEASTGTVTVQVAAATPVTLPVVAPPAVGAGSLTWGVKQSFRDYVSGSIAKGAITTSGVSTSGGAFVFSQASAGTFDRATGTGTSAYSGSVRFTGHNGILDVTLANPVVRVDSATSGTLLVTTGSRQIAFATLNLSAGSLSTPNNTLSYSGVPATLTAEGVAVFALNGSGFYPAGTPLDPVSFVIGAPSVSASTGSATVASFASVTRTPAKTVPAITGLTVSTADGSPLVEGGEVTITADGFQPNEKNILVVIYSDPVVLASNATADARGTVTWTGRLPAGLTGTHTLTLQGSVDRGVEVTIAAKAATTAVAGCVVDDATLTWGFKESFRSYISGSIAKGEWTVADGATYAVPDFGFSAGTGGYDPETGAGLLAFAGSIAFTGHGGLLNTTVSNPQLQLVDETSAILLLDISGTTQDGAAVDRAAVEFGSVDLTGAIAIENGVVTITSAPAVLTAAGSDAFGTYPEGEALDPITATFSVADDCAQPVEESDTPVTTMAEGEPGTAVAASENSEFGWILWVVLALVLIAAAVAVVLVVRRRAATRS